MKITSSCPQPANVIQDILKELDIKEYDPQVNIQLNEFVFRYATSILTEARIYAQNKKSQSIVAEDVRLAINLTNLTQFTSPPLREDVLDLAYMKNQQPLDIILKSSCGLKLPPDRHCLLQPNFIMAKPSQIPAPQCPALRIIARPNHMGPIKRSMNFLKTMQQQQQRARMPVPYDMPPERLVFRPRIQIVPKNGNETVVQQIDLNLQQSAEQN